MADRQRQSRRPAAGRVLLPALLLCWCCRAAPERLRYSIPEELGKGSLVGPLARDLGLSPAELPARKLRLSAAKQYFTVSGENGNLYVSERLDREEMCGKSASCSVSFEALVQNPLNVFHVDVAIQDVNDNAPRFLRDSFQLEINELTSTGARFPLGMADDVDAGSNSLQGYKLEDNEYFAVEVKESPDGRKVAELVLRRALDREREQSLRLVLTALDGGDPPRSGTAQLCINVTDANDNAPVFAQERYRVSLRENAPLGSTVLNVSASDADAGSNARITYGFGETPAEVLQKFLVDAGSGRITLQEALDFEDTRGYALLVEARDGGGLLAHCNVEVEVLDVNDNAPEITVLSVSSPVPEDAPAGTVVAVLNVKDPDSGENGQVWCELSAEAPLSLVASSGGSYKVVTASALDREQASEHRVTVVARDRGNPALSSSTALVLEVSDVNDNAPVFEEAAYSAYMVENNAAGELVLHVSARDADAGSNGRVRYSMEGGSAGAAPYVSVESQSGAVYAQRSFDYEQCREFAVVVRAHDGGSPSRSSTATVRVFVLDRKDNAPRVLWPAVLGSGVGQGAAPAAAPFEVVPRSAEAGYLVAKVVAVDADAGRNAWLSYELVQASEPALFRMGLHSGEVRTARAVSEKDAAKQRLVAVVKDHGQPALSATATLQVVLAESLQEALPELSERTAGADSAAELQFSLVLALALLSALFLLSVALAVLARGRRGGPPAVLRCLGAQRFSGPGAAFPADFCEGTLPYSYNLCVAPGRAVAEIAWPPPLPSLPAEELLGSKTCGEQSLTAGAGEPPEEPDAPQVCKPAVSEESQVVVREAGAMQSDQNSLRSAGGNPYAFREGVPADWIWARPGGQRSAALGACTAGRRLRAPLLTKEERDGSQSPAGSTPPAAALLDRWFSQRLGALLASRQYGAVLQRGGGACGSGRQRRRGPGDRPEAKKGERAEAAVSGREIIPAVQSPRDCGREMGAAGRRWGRWERALLWGILVAAWDAAWGQLRYSVPEELPKGSFVGNVEKDLGLELSALRNRGVRVVSEGRTQYFALHGKTGHLVTVEKIDREQLCESVQQCVLRCEVIVEEEMKVYKIEVEITDINDNAPSFQQEENELRMSEMTAPGWRLPLPEAHDPDSGPNSLQRYELNGDEHFSLAVQAGPGGDQRPELVLAKALDREEAAYHELVLRASDGGEPARTGTARIRVAVLDANDNAPVFSQEEYTVRVPEDVPVGSILVTVTASDADEGLNGHVKYSLKKITDKASKILQLDALTGTLTLMRTLDFEEMSSYELEVQAHDGGSLFDTAKVVITVTDVNDNAPEISVRSTLSEISEDAPLGTVVALLRVQDRDSGANGEVRCSIVETLPFHLEKNFEDYYRVVTAGELDREKVSRYNLTVRAVDGGSPALESSVVLALQVLDVNDNAPVFAEERYSARLAENNAAGALVLTVRATDADWGQNARVRYRLVEGRVRGTPLSSYVSVQAETGALYALRSFDYEEVREVLLWVWAEDGGSPALSSNVSVRLEIVDENDNAPQVLYPPPAAPSTVGSGWAGVELAPRSAEPGALVAKLVAVDADAGQNAWLSYELAKATEPGLFRVGLHSGEVRTARFPLARDASRQSLVVLVKDHGRPALSATATLTVVLAESLTELLSELGSAASAPGEPAGSLTRWLVLAVAAVSCLFLAFLLLLLALRLRRWRRSQLLAASGGTALRGVPASHFVGIDGVRAFLHSYSHEVSLTADSRKSHLRLSSGSCCDTLPAQPLPDEPAPLLGEDIAASRRADPAVPPCREESAGAAVDRRGGRGRLERCRQPRPLLPDSISGVSAAGRSPSVPAVRSRAASRQRGRQQQLPAVATRTGRRSRNRHNGREGGKCLRQWMGGWEMGTAGRRCSRCERALLWGILVAAWDAAWGQLRYSVPEELPKGSFVGDLTKDLGLELPVLRDRGIRVISEGRTQYFALHGKMGRLVTAERIDREQLCRLAEKCVLRCEVIVEEEMKVYKIEVEITDINDNAPSFRQADKELRMSETTAPGWRLPLPEAHDPDSGPNSLQRYELNGDEHFSLAVQAGPGGDQRPELVLAKALDREEAAYHELVLRASDGGEPARTGTARIRVAVLDANDNAPVFSQEEYTVRVPEDVPVGSILVTVTASDADEGLNGHVKYIFHKISDRASELFQLDSETGAISLKDDLDFEEISTHELQVQALDGGELFDTAKIAITVTDVNDNAPEISVRSTLSEISEDAPLGTVVALLHVQDRDSGANGGVRCSIVETLPFHLEKNFEDYYRVVTAGELDCEKVSEYNLTVRAVDGGSPSLQSSAVLALRVLDVNDNAPVFAEERYSARLAENNAAGALVLTVRATDADWGQNARVRYRLVEGRVRGTPLSSYVSVQAETGALYALRSFDYEEVREVRLWVWAEDGGSPSLSSNVSVRLEIMDENDNAPQVLYPPPAAPSAAGSGGAGVELAPRSAEPGALVAKVVAVDADAGQNAWLSYELAKATEPGLFRVGLHSGEVRTARFPLARDASRQSLVVLVKDHGRPALSATATLTVVLAESVAELLSELGSAAAAPGEPADSLTRWLVLAVAAVSCLFLAFLLLLLALRLRRWRRSQLLAASGSTALRGVPASHFVGIDGVRAFLHSYSHEVSLTADSRKSHLRLSSGSCCDTLPARPPSDEPAPLVVEGPPAPRRADPSAPTSRVVMEAVGGANNGIIAYYLNYISSLKAIIKKRWYRFGVLVSVLVEERRNGVTTFFYEQAFGCSAAWFFGGCRFKFI
ncbi:LOW QUALITY PROTEIN: uncharacterized protein AAGF69_011239 [Amazona ochrocephala]